jgi:hypothetical protein
MTEIQCKNCGLFLGITEMPVEIECPICIELRYEIKRALSLAPEIPYAAQGWVYAVRRADGFAENILRKFERLKGGFEW